MKTAVHKPIVCIVPSFFAICDYISVRFGIAQIHVLIGVIKSEYHHFRRYLVVFVLQFVGGFAAEFLLDLGD